MMLNTKQQQIKALDGDLQKHRTFVRISGCFVLIVECVTE